MYKAEVVPGNVVVIGGTGLIGERLVRTPLESGVVAIAASTSTEVNAMTGEGISRVVANASVVVNVSNSPSYEDGEVIDFFNNSQQSDSMPINTF